MSLSIASRPYGVPVSRLLWKAASVLLLLTIIAGAIGMTMPADRKLGWTLFGNDLMPSYAAGQLIREGQVDQIYNPYAVKRVIRSLWAEHYAQHPMSDGLAPWLNPPAFALLFVPLAGLPYGQAMTVWIGFNVACLTIACLLLMKLLPTGTPRSVRWLVPLLVLTSFPLLQAICHQQNTFLSLAILAATLLLATRSRDAATVRWSRPLTYATGAVAGLLLFKPQLGALVAIAIAAVAGYRALIGAALTGTVLLAIGERALPGATWEFLLGLSDTVRLVQERADYHWQRQTTLLAFWRMLFQRDLGGPTFPAIKLLWLASMGVIAFTLTRTGVAAWLSKDATTSRRWLATAIVAMPLVMPYYMDYDLLLLTAAGVLYAGDVVMKGGLTYSDRWVVRSWLTLAIVMPLEPVLGAILSVNFNTMALTMLTLTMVQQIHAKRAMTSVCSTPLGRSPGSLEPMHQRAA